MLGRPAYRVVVDAARMSRKARTHPERARLRRILRTRPVFVHARVRTGNLAAAEFLQALGFRLADTNLVFEKPIERRRRIVGNCTVRFVESADEPQAVALARRAFTFSRFHVDPKIGRKTANGLKAEWVRNFFHGKRGEAMVVAVAREKIVGFLQLLRSGDGTLVIDLIAVDRRHRGRGIAGAMISFAESRCKGAKRIRVGTQVANLPSIRMYEKLGFKVSDANYLFHYHRL